MNGDKNAVTFDQNSVNRGGILYDRLLLVMVVISIAEVVSLRRTNSDIFGADGILLINAKLRRSRTASASD